MKNLRLTGMKAWLRTGCAVAATVLVVGGGMSVVARAASAQSISAPSSGSLVTLVPNRIADSRIGESFDTFGAVEEQDLQVAGRGGVPLTGVSSVVLNVTAVAAHKNGYLTVWPFSYGRPNTSNVNFAAGQTIANTVIVKLSSDGTISLFNGSSGDLDVLVDVEGYVPS